MLKTLLVLLAMFLAFGIAGRLDYEIGAATARDGVTRMTCPAMNDRDVHDAPLVPASRQKVLVAFSKRLSEGGGRRNPIARRKT